MNKALIQSTIYLRYTSYPTVLFGIEGIAYKDRISSMKRPDESNAKEGISLYIHLPFLKTYNFCTQ